MSRVDLSIVDRGTQGTTWIAEDIALTPEHLDDVLEQKTDNSGALNSLPTPFARFFVAKEAFRRAKEEHINPQKTAGFAYSQLVSDILDVYELLFNRKYHENIWEGEPKLELREWDSAQCLNDIKTKMPVLFNSINEYYATDIAESKLYFLVFTDGGKDKLLACTSPLTGFITPPDIDKVQIKKDGTIQTEFAGELYQNLQIRRKSGGLYFRDKKMFEDRDADFKNYMYNELLGSANVDAKFKEIKEYILSFKADPDIRNDYQLKLTGTKTDQNNDLVVNGLKIFSSDAIDINSYFNPTIIKIPYRIDRERFIAVEYQNDVENREYDYLLPFKPEVASLFNGGEIKSSLHINRDSVTVSLFYNNKEYKKDYYPIDLDASNAGRIVDFKEAKISFDLGLFPNILSYKPEENNYFKVLVIGADESPDAPNFNIDKISLSFFKRIGNNVSPIKEFAEHDADYGVLPAVVRSRQKNGDIDGGTKFYELFNTSFEMIEVEVMGDRGLLRPRWEPSKNSNTTFTYAIDLGTSNTFMSRCKDGENNLPELLTMDCPMVSYLHESRIDPQISKARQIENSIFSKAVNRIKTEFLPALIDGKDYKFPIRTALCGILSKKDHPKLFDNQNIAFFYEKLMPDDDQNVQTDIKWQKEGESIRVFIQELLLIVKCDILQHGGDLDRTKLVWFRPLSFSGNIRTLYENAWKEEASKILKIGESQIACFSESEAPYYYFKKKNYIKDSEAVSVVDIGGGSTDFVYFKDNQPIMSSSVHFGCDVLWGNGFSEFENEKQNGIYNKLAGTLRFSSPQLEDLNTCFNNIDKNKTKDIINFWLSNSDKCDIRKRLQEDFKPVFAYHFSSILFYMASMYKDYEYMAPRTVVFSGNGSKYIDGFICSDKNVIKSIVDLVFTNVFGEKQDIKLELPPERKESTCYGGLYRNPDAVAVPEKVYHGDLSKDYKTVGDVNKNFDNLKRCLSAKYSDFANIYKDVLDLLKLQKVLDPTADTTKYANLAKEDMDVPLNTYYQSQVKGVYEDEVPLFDSIFFLPIIDRVFEMTKI